MRPLRHLLLLILTLLLCGCSGGEFSVDFQLDPGLRQNYHVIYYSFRKGGGKLVEAAIPVTEGRFLLKGYSKRQTLILLYGTGEEPALAFMAEPGNELIVSGSGSDPKNWSVKGNKTDEIWSEWRAKNAKALNGNYKEVNRTVADFVKGHPKDILSAILMLTLYDRRNDEEGYIKLWNSIAASAKPMELLQSVGRSDQLMTEAYPPQPVDTLVLHTPDTLLPIASKASDLLLLHFWRTSDKERNAAVDSLKKLRSTFADTLKLAMADISFESDSLSWRRVVRTDSVENWIRAWAPAAEASEVAMTLSVTRTPYYILIDKKGNQKFRTGNLEDILKETRKSLRK